MHINVDVHINNDDHVAVRIQERCSHHRFQKGLVPGSVFGTKGTRIFITAKIIIFNLNCQILRIIENGAKISGFVILFKI